MTSVYFFDTDFEGFGACFLVKKSKFFMKIIYSLIEIEGERGIKEGSWDSIHVVRC